MKIRSSSISKSILPALSLAAALLPLGRLQADSLWKDAHSQPMCADKKAHRVGDILTIVVQENNGATRANNTATTKKNSVDAAITSFLYSPAASGLLTKGGSLPALKYAADTEFAGGGTINNSETITAQIAVRVMDVLPNGNMVIEGNLHTAFSGEKQDAVVRGTVRPDDVQANNTLFSYNIADASIQFLGKGTISDNQRKGWFTRIWDKISPF
ncbi:MAG: flgH [Pedosphaera sp.]|nr:flgH [Pedosphaera sp.]